jgi:hypothetical protein
MSELTNPVIWSLEWWKTAIDILQSLFVIATALVALVGVNEWRRQTLGKRKIELAEQVLTSFYEAREAFVWIRSPGAFGGEGETRQHQDGEEAEVRRLRNAYFVPIERMQKHSELFAKLQSQRYSFMTLFGLQTVEPFNELRMVQARISVSAQNLIRMAGNRGARRSNAPLWDRCESDIWDGMYEARDEQDPIKQSIENAVSRVEGICRPVLLSQPGAKSSIFSKLMSFLK